MGSECGSNKLSRGQSVAVVNSHSGRKFGGCFVWVQMLCDQLVGVEGKSKHRVGILPQICFPFFVVKGI